MALSERTERSFLLMARHCCRLKEPHCARRQAYRSCAQSPLRRPWQSSRPEECREAVSHQFAGRMCRTWLAGFRKCGLICQCAAHMTKTRCFIPRSTHGSTPPHHYIRTVRNRYCCVRHVLPRVVRHMCRKTHISGLLVNVLKIADNRVWDRYPCGAVCAVRSAPSIRTGSDRH